MLAELGPHPNAHFDRGNENLLLFWRGAHAGALAAHERGDKGRAAKIVALAVRTPPVTGEPGGDAVEICLGEVGECTLSVHLPEAGQKGPKAAVRVATDLGFLLEQAGEPLRASDLLGQITTRFPDYTPAWLNLGDALARLGRSQAAGSAYRAYVRLRRAEKRAVPERVTRWLEANGRR